MEKCEKLKKQKEKYKFRLEEAEKRIKGLEFELALEAKTSTRGSTGLRSEPRGYDLESLRDRIRSIKSHKQYK